MKKAGQKGHFPAALSKAALFSSDFLDSTAEYHLRTDRGVDIEPQRDLESRTEDMLEEMARSRSRLMVELRESMTGSTDPAVGEVVKTIESLSKAQQMKVYEILGEMVTRKGENSSQSFQSPKPKAVLHRHVISTSEASHLRQTQSQPPHQSTALPCLWQRTRLPSA